MKDTPVTTELLRRWRSGDEQAAAELFQQFAAKLTALADSQLSERLKRRVAGEDVVQSVFRTFFRRSADGQFQINNSGELWRLLVTITLAKTRNQARRHTAGTRDVRVESGGGLEDWVFESLAREPQPEDAAILVDQIDGILQGLPEEYGQMLALLLEGNTRTEVARQMNVSRQTVYRALRLFQQRLKDGLKEL